MKIWLVQANEPMPIVDDKQRFFRTGMTAEELNIRGHDITWFAGTFDHYTKKKRFTENKLIEVNSHYYIQFLYGMEYAKNISLRRLVNHLQIASNFKKKINVMEKPNLIYCSFPTIALSKACVEYGKKNNIPVILDVRDLWPEVFERVLPKPFSYILKPLHKEVNRILRSANGIHSVSNECLNYILDKVKRPKNSFDKSYFIGYSGKYGLVPSEKQFIFESDKLLIPFVGTLSNQINYDLIIELAKNVDKKIEFIICGSGPMENEFKKLSKECKNIKFVGWVNVEEIKNYLNKAFMALIPYNNTLDFQMGAGNKFGEALCYSLPVALLCNGVMANLVRDYDCGYYHSEVKNIANYINMLAKNKTIYNEKAVNARKLYEEQFCSDIIYRDLVDFLEGIMEVE